MQIERFITGVYHFSVHGSSGLYFSPGGVNQQEGEPRGAQGGPGNAEGDADPTLVTQHVPEAGAHRVGLRPGGGVVITLAENYSNGREITVCHTVVTPVCHTVISLI